MRRIIILIIGLMSVGIARGAEVSPAIAEAANQFAADLYRHWPGDGNLFCSPLSIYGAMMMARAGAGGKTAEEMTAVLHAPAGDADAAAGGLLARLEAPDQDFQLHIANAIWARNGFICLPAFQDRVTKDYHSAFSNLDFSDGVWASKTINAWVSDKTEGKIAELFSAGTLPRDAMMVLANAIYFHADWSSAFLPERSGPGDFYVLGKPDPVRRTMMHQQGSFPLMRGDGFDAVELPYKGDKISMVIVLPRANDGIKSLESRISGEFLNRVAAGVGPTFVEVTIPKFSFSEGTSLAGVLKGMGMRRAFEAGEADFSGIDGSGRLFLSEVIHKARVSVDEKGTEAAAATGAVMMPTAVPMPRNVFCADHAFLFVIRDRGTGAVLFMGRVEDPGAG